MQASSSKPVEPIVYHLDRGTPEPIRTALLEGARWWADAFEAAGYEDAFQVAMLPEDADPMDIRYNVIQWVHRSTRGWSYGSTVVDPRTGEILKGHVTLGSLRVRQDLLIARGLLAGGDPAVMDAVMDQAMEKFISALCHLDEPAKAAEFADQSLGHSMELGEALAMSHADLFLERRKITKGIKRHSFGCYLDTERITDIEYLKLLKKNFQYVTIPVSWKMIEPKEQERQFEHLDACVNWLSKHHIAVKIGPLLSFVPENLPDWLFIWENDFEQVREMAYEYVTTVVVKRTFACSSSAIRSATVRSRPTASSRS